MLQIYWKLLKIEGKQAKLALPLWNFVNGHCILGLDISILFFKRRNNG